MIDFIKGLIINTPPENLINSQYLDFSYRVMSDTGECGKWLTAYYRGLKIRVQMIGESKRIILEGSLHKYRNEGLHNFDDFSEEDLNGVIADLHSKFGIIPDNIMLTQLEVGVNINPPEETKGILEKCFFHKTMPFKWVYTNDEGNYIQVQHTGYFIKIYDKQKQYSNQGYSINRPVMRFEIKFKRKKLHLELKQKTRISLQDVLTFEMKAFRSILLREWNHVLFYDEKSVEISFRETYSNPNYWRNLTYEQFKYNRNRLNQFIKSNSDSLKNIIAQKLESKIGQLCSKFPE